MKKLCISSLFLIITSCSSFLEVPQESLSNLSKETSRDNERAALLSSKIGKESINCDDLKELSLNKNFKLQAWIHANYIQECSPDPKEINKTYKSLKSYPKWSHPFLLKSLIKVSKDKEILVRAKVDLTPFLNTSSEKVRNLKGALKIAHNKSLREYVQSELEKTAPRFTKDVNMKNMFEVARSFEKNRQFKYARKLYRKIINHESTDIKEVISAWNRVRLSYKLERDKKTYRQKTYSLVQYLKRNSHNPHAREKLFEYSNSLARIYWTQDKLHTAIKILRNLLVLKDIPQKHKARAYFSLGGIYEDLGNKKRTMHFYIKAYEESASDESFQETILWNISWYFYRTKKFKKAKKWLLKHQSEEPSYKFKFWLAKTYQKLNDHKKAKRLYEELKSEDNFGFYGQMSHHIDGTITNISEYKDSFTYKSNALSWALYIDNHEVAQSIVDNTPKEEIDFDELYHAKYFDKLIFKFFASKKEDKKNILENYPEFSFPLAYKNDFIKNNKSNYVSAPLLMSIARQESAFNTYARSPADAFGLLQLIPSQAKRLSKRYKIPYSNFNDLYTPSTNIALSSRLLDELMKRQSRNFVYFIASYNAGERPVKRWRKRIRTKDIMEFIESIPYKETRKYVKLVARNYFVYKRLLANKPIKISEKFFTQGSY